MASYKVLSSLLHDGKKYEIGELVELDQTNAALLVTILEPQAKKPKPQAHDLTGEPMPKGNISKPNQ